VTKFAPSQRREPEFIGSGQGEVGYWVLRKELIDGMGFVRREIVEHNMNLVCDVFPSTLPVLTFSTA
jgi:hypothetical protein